ncbi:hypothetical protein Leryth_027056 [Lithospermum erythrorhizon]|nr:hypothetical protein Leryth_027056 [Lithospermum erythrorhizon]
MKIIKNSITRANKLNKKIVVLNDSRNLSSGLVANHGHGTGFGTLLAGGAAAAAAAYGTRHHGYGGLGYHNGGGYHGHYGHHGKFKHGKFKGKHYGGHKFKKWK